MSNGNGRDEWDEATQTSATTSEVHVGDTLDGKYAVVRELGRGGMGAVFEAENTWTTRRVAIKVLRPDIAADGDAVERFRREARTATQLAHPNIVDVLDMGRDRRTGSLFIVQELLQGGDLHRHAKARGRLPSREALDVMVPVMGALVAAHGRGVLHRDIKPENIFLAQGAGGEVTPKLIDFGLSKVTHEAEALRMTSTGTVMGTPYYMAPEQVRGVKDLDGRVDVWAVGAVLFELLSGRVPFEAENYNLLMVKILSEPAPRLGAVASDVPAGLAAVVDGALQSDREKRHPTMKAFLDALLDAKVLGESGNALLRERHRRSLNMSPPTPEDAQQLAFARTGQWSEVEAPVVADRAEGNSAPRSTPFGWSRATGARAVGTGAALAIGAVVGLLAGATVFVATRGRATTSVAVPRVEAPRVEAPRVEAPRVEAPREGGRAVVVQVEDAGVQARAGDGAADAGTRAARTRRGRGQRSGGDGQPRWGWGGGQDAR